MSTNDTLRGLVEALQEIVDCPQWVEQATVPRAGIEAAPQQVVMNMSVGLMRLRKARAALEAAALAEPVTGGVVPEGWKIEPFAGGFIVSSPRIAGVSSGTFAHPQSEDPANQLLALMLERLTALNGGAVAGQVGIAEGLRAAAKWHMERCALFTEQMHADEKTYQATTGMQDTDPRRERALRRWEGSSCNAANHRDYAAELERQADAISKAPAKAEPVNQCDYCNRQGRDACTCKGGE